MSLSELIVPTEKPAPSADITRREPLQLELSLAEAWPWPGLIVRAAVHLGSALIRLRKLSRHREGFRCHGVLLEADAVDDLIVRAILGLSTIDGVAYRASGSEFAPVLALLRQSSENVLRRESERVAACAVLNQAPVRALAIRSPITAGGPVRAQPSYRSPETGALLGWPVLRDDHWWVFPAAIAPAIAPLDEPSVRALFDSGPRELSGDEALRLARAAATVSGLQLSLPGELTAALTPAGAGSGTVGHDTSSAGTAPPAVAKAGATESVPSRSCAWVALDVKAPPRPPAPAQPAKPAPVPASPWNVYVSEPRAGARPAEDGADEFELHLGAGEDPWYRFAGALEGHGHALTEEEIARLMRLRQKWLRQNSSGTPAAAWFAPGRAPWCSPKLHAVGAEVGGFLAEARERVGELFSLAGTVERARRYYAFLERLRTFESLRPAPPPAGLRLTLRPYQAHGYHWLRFLTQYGLNGILADDMGLGKTAQSLALLAALREREGSWPSLIVCPTSLVDNWAAEALKFTPNLRVLRYRGAPSRRDLLRKRISEQDIVLTSYATARNDASLLKDEQWRYVILDEAHTIKNAAAATTKALKTIPARHRLALTGTPVQNRLDELWSLFDFLMPGYLGRRAFFFRQYEEPIVKGQTPGACPADGRRGSRALEELRERIGPFVLRRLKSDVAKDLPAKIQQDIPCRLTADQVALYRQFTQSDQARDAVRELEEHGPGRAQAQILTALTSLRKICNHPDLMYLAREVSAGKRIVPLPGYEARAGKFPALIDLLEQCRAGGHRALLFCQLTSMLDILEHLLAARRDSFLRLDGSTPGAARQELVDRFNADASILAFLISTRAGGTGLNLTGADTVIFYDHDWNPAGDRQAQDRAHRLGQTRAVNVYRLVTQGTVEEKILERQARKQGLADAVICPDAAGIKDLTRDELLALFTFTAPAGTE